MGNGCLAFDPHPPASETNEKPRNVRARSPLRLKPFLFQESPNRPFAQRTLGILIREIRHLSGSGSGNEEQARVVRIELDRWSGRVRLLSRKQVDVPPVLTLIRFLIALRIHPIIGKAVLGTVVLYRKKRLRSDRNHPGIFPAPEFGHLHEQGLVRYRRIDGKRPVQAGFFVGFLSESLTVPEVPHGSTVVIPQDAPFENRFRVALSHAGMVEIAVYGFFGRIVSGPSAVDVGGCGNSENKETCEPCRSKNGSNESFQGDFYEISTRLQVKIFKFLKKTLNPV